jgi:hypothetical protein
MGSTNICSGVLLNLSSASSAELLAVYTNPITAHRIQNRVSGRSVSTDVNFGLWLSRYRISVRSRTGAVFSALGRVAIALTVLVAISVTNAWAESKFPLRVSDNGRYLVDRKSLPFLIHGDAAWSLFTGLTREEAAEYVSARKRQGFNTVLVNVLDDSYTHLKDGTKPFRDKQDFSRPEELYFRHIENILSIALREELLVMLVPVYLGCCEGGWKAAAGANTVEEMRKFGRYLGERFRKYPNVWWVLGGDRDPDTGFENHPASLRRHVDALARGIKEGWPDSILTAHTAHNSSARQQYPDEPWLDINNIYTYYPEENRNPHVYVWAYREYQRNHVMPFFLIESAYESDQRKGQTRSTIRRQAYWALLGGACGHIYGHGLTWGAKEGWRRGLDAPGAGDMTQLKMFFDKIPWHRLQPDLDARFVTAGQSNFGDDRWITAVLADDRSLALVYVPQAMERVSIRQRLQILLKGEYGTAWTGFRPRSVSIDLTRLSNVVSVAWFFPATGLTEEVGSGRQSATGVGSYDVPCHGDIQECDALLVVRAGK